jgi:hypothetical protein
MTILGKLKGEMNRIPVQAANKAFFVLVLFTVFLVPVIQMTFRRITYCILLTSIFLPGTWLISNHRALSLSFAVLVVSIVRIAEGMALN